MNATLALLGQFPISASLIVAGMALMIQGLRRMIQPIGTMVGLAWICGFRVAVIGLSLLFIGAAGVWQQAWLLAVGLVIGMEETMETSVIIAAIRHEPRSDAGRRRIS